MQQFYYAEITVSAQTIAYYLYTFVQKLSLNQTCTAQLADNLKRQDTSATFYRFRNKYLTRSLTDMTTPWTSSFFRKILASSTGLKTGAPSSPDLLSFMKKSCQQGRKERNSV
jgi:hypothetical protein